MSDPESRPTTYVGFLCCALCGCTMQTHQDSKGYWSYFCPRKRDCSRRYSAAKPADPQIDAALERLLGNRETLARLVEESAREGERRAASPPAETTRRITELQNRRARVKDAYVAGVFDLKELQKRIGVIDGDLSVLEGLLSPPEPETVDIEAITAVASAFALWGLQTRQEKRSQMRALRLRIFTNKAARGKIKIDKIEIGLLDDLSIYN